MSRLVVGGSKMQEFQPRHLGHATILILLATKEMKRKKRGLP